MRKYFKMMYIKKSHRCMESYEISMNELKEKQEHGAIIVDVRSSQEYNEGHVLNAINIPDYKINKSIKKILTNKNQEIVLYCSSGGRGRKAYQKMKNLGYNNVFNLYKGLDNWI